MKKVVSAASPSRSRRRLLRAALAIHGQLGRARTWPAALWKKRRPIAKSLLALAALPFVLVAVLALVTPLPPELREPPAPSIRVVTPSGHLLREVRTDDGARARPLPLSAFPLHTQNAVLAAEDRHFRSHFGVDLVAVARAAGKNLWHRRIVSGASTITMQLARTVRPHRRDLWGKLREVALAIRIERSLSKDEILEQYVNRVIYGPNVRGYAAASEAYLGTAPASLSVSQAALIAGLPRGPSLYALGKRPDLARRRRDRVLQRMADAAMIDEGALTRARDEPIVVGALTPSFGAPHLVRGIVGGAAARVQPGLADVLADRGALSEITTTIDPEIQRTAEAAVLTTLASLAPKHVTAASVVVLDNATGDVLAWIGAPDFFDERRLGQNDGVLALRQPGSSLKPFVYAEAMASLGYTPATMLPDVELHIPLPGGGDYVPHDYDTKLRGPVRLREALGNSLNVPAVDTIHRLGTARVLDRLHAFGFASLTEDAEHYGPALALGDGEVTLLELTNAYAALARGGILKPVRLVSRISRGDVATSFEPAKGTRVLDERSAAMLGDVLSDRTARMSAFGDQNVLELPFDVAAKTGTSKGFRDNVAVGYTRAVTVGVWVGNFDGSSMRDVTGITGAGPIFRTVIEAAVRLRSRGTSALGIGTDGARLGLVRTPVCALSGEIATASCPHRIQEWLPEGDHDHAPACSVHVPVRLDLRNGLLAGSGCARDITEQRVVERWAAPYLDWARRTGRALIPDASSPECPTEDARATADGTASSGAEAPRITYPFDGSRFVIDPDRPIDLQRLDARVEPDSQTIEIEVDGVPLPRSRSWRLESGPHVLRAYDRVTKTASQPVHVTVR